MYSRSLALFVSFICATSSLAAPVPSPDVAGLVNGVVSSVDIPIPSLPPVVGTTVGDALAKVDEVVPVDGLLPRDQLSLPQVFQDLTAKATPFIDNLKTAVADKANVDAQLLESNLQNIIDLLTSTQAELQTIVQNPIAVVQSLLSVNSILALLGPLVQLLVTVLSLVVGIVGSTPLGPVVLPLVATIGNLVGSIITLAVQLVPGLLNALLPTLTSLVPALGDLNLTSILSLIPSL